MMVPKNEVWSRKVSETKAYRAGRVQRCMLCVLLLFAFLLFLFFVVGLIVCFGWGWGVVGGGGGGTDHPCFSVVKSFNRKL